MCVICDCVLCVCLMRILKCCYAWILQIFYVFYARCYKWAENVIRIKKNVMMSSHRKQSTKIFKYLPHISSYELVTFGFLMGKWKIGKMWNHNDRCFFFGAKPGIKLCWRTMKTNKKVTKILWKLVKKKVTNSCIFLQTLNTQC